VWGGAWVCGKHCDFYDEEIYSELLLKAAEEVSGNPRGPPRTLQGLDILEEKVIMSNCLQQRREAHARG